MTTSMIARLTRCGCAFRAGAAGGAGGAGGALVLPLVLRWCAGEKDVLLRILRLLLLFLGREMWHAQRCT